MRLGCTLGGYLLLLLWLLGGVVLHLEAWRIRRRNRRERAAIEGARAWASAALAEVKAHNVAALRLHRASVEGHVPGEQGPREREREGHGPPDDDPR